ncbi:hypothetical protein [Myxosarcina sp. GI1]|uniref:hypothetical protein n=1 Tax=Myxosarcina sp. GI1 TaxID=1541065 RepID=UPI0012E0415D|nr:hypothetical protein [Myxosarcina sp. GI1]
MRVRAVRRKTQGNAPHVDAEGTAFDFKLICYTAAAAELEGRAAIETGLGL